jgi:hypothetical protein
MATKRKGSDHTNGAPSTKKGRNVKKAGGPIDLTSDSDDDDTKTKKNGSNGSSSSNGGHAPAAAVLSVGKGVIGQSVVETKKAAVAPVPVVAVPPFAAAANAIVAPVAVAAVGTAPNVVSSSSSSSRVSASPSPPLSSPVAAGTYKQSEAYAAATVVRMIWIHS